MCDCAWSSAKQKCDRCGAVRELYYVHIPHDHEDGVWTHRTVRLCENCLSDFAEACEEWWEDLPI